MPIRKFRIGSRVRHRKLAYLGIGSVWELRNNGRVSVHWDLKFGASAALRRVFNMRHYRPENLELVEGVTDLE